tara:strand:- start:124 stop:576 length:453 start_codon:yes stop_codon:yes gene_type:complete
VAEPVVSSKAEFDRHGSVGMLASVIQQLIQRQHQGPWVDLNHQIVSAFQALQHEIRNQLPRGVMPALKQRSQEMVTTADHLRIHLQAREQREMTEQLLNPRHLFTGHRQARAEGLGEIAQTSHPLQIPAHDRQGRAQLMGQISHEALLLN